MGTLQLTNRGKAFTFRPLVFEDLAFIKESFGLEDFQKTIGDMTDLPKLSATLYKIMLHLLEKPSYNTVEEFSEAFGVSYHDVALLYTQLNKCVGNANEVAYDVARLQEKNTQLKRKNRELQFQILREKAKNLISIFR